MTPLIEAYGKAVQDGIVWADDTSGTQVAWCFEELGLQEVSDLRKVGVDDLLAVPSMTLRGVLAVMLFAQHHGIHLTRGRRLA